MIKRKASIPTKLMMARLKAKVRECGGVAKAAKHFGVQASWLRSVLNMAELPGPRILEALELYPIKTINYRYGPISEKDSES